MPFRELHENLNSIQGELTKLGTAVAHIEQSKEAAVKAVNAAETTNKEFKNHLLKVTADVDSILKPHKELIASTEKLTKTIEAIDFPKQLKLIKIIAIATGGAVVIGTVLILILCHN